MSGPSFDEPLAATSKVDPETLVLRGRPRRVVRFRRKVIITIATLGSTAIIGATWIALRPATLHIARHDGENQEAASKMAPDAIASAPKSYADVPQLGPPLPGDLGPSILAQQRSLGTVSSAAPDQAEEAERQQVEADRLAAHKSAIMVKLPAGRAPARTAGSAAPPAVPAAAFDQPGSAAGLADDPGHQQQKAGFIAAKDQTGDVNPHVLTPPASPYMLSAGTVIAASLITGLNSDLPGLVTAQVTENVYDSATGDILLIPQGSRLIGSYDSVVAFGQKRALVIWQRIVLPNGSSVRIDNLPATDAAGYAGLSDKVEGHTWQLIKGVALSTLLGVGSQLSIGDDSDLVRAIRESTQQSASQAGSQMVAKNLDVQPTIIVRPGWPLRVIVHKDIVLRPWHGQGEQ